jgi:hypothetical protein
MSNKYHSIFEATYGIQDVILEINRSQGARDAAFGSAQASYDAMTPDYQELDPEMVSARAAEEAMNAVESEAMQYGFENIDAYAMQEYGLQPTTTNDGQPYSPGEQLIDQTTELYEEMIM